MVAVCKFARYMHDLVIFSESRKAMARLLLGSLSVLKWFTSYSSLGKFAFLIPFRSRMVNLVKDSTYVIFVGHYSNFCWEAFAECMLPS